MGIIIADEGRQTELFNRADSNQIISFYEEIQNKYDKVILHLGKDFVFRKGNIYSTETSKKNLELFCRKMKQSGIKIYLWFFDSWGHDGFQKLYKIYQPAAEENMKILNSYHIYYDGIAVDIEWINHGTENRANNRKFHEIILRLKTLSANKPVWYFTSLIDSETENINRGYDIKSLQKSDARPVTMLYIKDGGYSFHKRKLVPDMDDTRLRELIKYYKKNKIEVAFSIEKMLVQKSGKEEKIMKPGEFARLQNSLLRIKSKKYKFYTINEYANRDKSEGWQIYELIPRTNKTEDNFYLWEYFSMQQQ